MKCRYCNKDSEENTGYWFSDGGSAEQEGDFICVYCFEKCSKKLNKNNKRCKIGRYTYERISKDKNDEPKILRNWEDEDIFTLVDFDGEPLEYLRRIKGVKNDIN